MTKSQQKKDLKDLKITEALNKYYNSRATFIHSESHDAREL